MDRDTLNYFCNVHNTLCESLKALPKQDISRPSIQKNRLYDLSSFNILPQDQAFFMRLIDSAVLNSQLVESLKSLVITYKFGQKQSTEFNLEEICDVSSLRCISVHSACDISSANGAVHHFWSRYALQDLVGTPGTLFSALSLREAVNFQSNLDGRQMDIDAHLRAVATYPRDITFIQLYADTPHTRLPNTRLHPITGDIVCCGLLHPNTTQSMYNHSVTYLRHMEELTVKLQKPSVARIETVTLITPEQVPALFRAEDFFCMVSLKQLIQTRPMLVPFKETVTGGSFMGFMRSLATCLVNTLTKQHLTAKGKGTFAEAWTAYQEVFFWGHAQSSVVWFC
ncbi:hypothetical protein AMEX_G23801 [Astyanax mexicanus]|uniref:Uncharacterized protein n=1 Tax=Astyanax mexicanus TaxID=7994 RepID=A0A8T2KTT2_ASTMX|nr:hypothetical protein AMEX_G23801 [Astyanax mexicanus]